MIEATTTAGCLVLMVLLLVSSATDLTWHRIPNIVLMPALLIALGLQTAGAGLAGLVTAAGGLAIGLALLLPLYALGGMGAGDVKLLGVVGAFLGPWGVLIAGLVTFIAGAVFGLLVIFWRFIRPMIAGNSDLLQLNATKRGGIAYAPSITVGALTAMWQSGVLATLTMS